MPAPRCQPKGLPKAAYRVYQPAMVTFVAILLGLAMLATLGTLFAGMIGLARGNGDPMRSNRLMRWRVIMQGVSILLFLLLMSMISR